MPQGGSGVGDEIYHFGQSHKFADGNVHIVGANRVACGSVLRPLRTDGGAYLITDTLLAIHWHVMSS